MPETRKRDDAAASGEDELRGVGVRSREKESKTDGQWSAGVVDKSVGKEAELVVASRRGS